MIRPLIIAAAALLAAAPAGAQEMDHSAMGHAAPASEGGSDAAFRAANAKMHADMAVDLTGDADVDFVRSMIPHHQGAIDMARIVIEHGNDPELRALAEEIVATQETELARMQEWLAANAPDGAAVAQ
jgi:uncharacterized protein (DUF305 family)